MYTAFIDNGSGEQLLYAPINGSDAVILQPKLSSEVNKADSFTFVLPPVNPMYGHIAKLATIVTLYDGLKLVFRGRIRSARRAMNNCLNISCEAELSFLADVDMLPYNATEGIPQDSRTVSGWVRYYLSQYNDVAHAERQIAAGTLPSTTDYSNSYIRANENISNVLTELLSLATDYGMQLSTRRESGQTYLDVQPLPSVVATGSQTIEFGKNILSLDEYADSENVATRVRGVNADIGSHTEINTTVEALYKTQVLRIVEFSDLTTMNELESFTRAELQKRLGFTSSITVNAVDLHLLDESVNPFEVGNIYKFTSTAHGLDADLRCTRIDLDLAAPKKNKYVFGIKTKTLTDQLSGRD